MKCGSGKIDRSVERPRVDLASHQTAGQISGVVDSLRHNPSRQETILIVPCV